MAQPAAVARRPCRGSAAIGGGLRRSGAARAIIRKYDEVLPDLIIVFSCNVAQYAEHFAGVPRIMQFHDLDSLKWAQYGERTNALLRWVYRIEADRLLAYERSIARRFSHALVCTAGEQHDFERLFPGLGVSLVGNGVDLDYFRSCGAKKRAGAIVFTGVMDYFPNVDAVTWFCERILPVVQAQIPEASLTICGNRPNTAVTRLAKRPGVTVTGRVPDTRPFSTRRKYSSRRCGLPVGFRTRSSRRWQWGCLASRRVRGAAPSSRRGTAFSSPTTQPNLPSTSSSC